MASQRRVQTQRERFVPLAARWLIGLAKWAHVAVATALIFGLAYYLGHSMLSGPLKGNDSGMHVAYALWVDKYFPNFPHWYPLQGGGESIVHGYPMLAHLLVALVGRVANLSILQAFRLVSFMSFPLSALGVYAFCWKALKSQTTGLIAAIFFLLAPMTWTWTYDWGFFAQGVGIVFVLPALICFDGVLSPRLHGPRSGRRRLWQAGMICALILASLSHPLTGAGAVVGMGLYVVFAALLGEPGRRQRALTLGLKAIFTSGFVVALILAFYLIPFYRYSLVANREGLNVLPLAGIPHLPYLQFFGLRPSDPALVLTRAANPLVTTVFVALALTLLARRSRTALAWVLVALAAAVYSLIPGFQYAISSVLPILSLVLSFRSTTVLAIVLFPVAAGIGAWAIADLFVATVRGALRPSPPEPLAQRLGVDLPGIASSILAALLAFVAAFQLGHLTSGEPFRLSYGPKSAGIDLRDMWNQRASDACLTPGQSPLIAGLCGLPAARTQLHIQEFAQECDHVRDQGLQSPALCQSRAPTHAELEAFVAECRSGRGSVSTTADPCRAVVQSRLGQLLMSSWPSLSLSNEDPSITRSQALAGQLPEQPMLRIDVSPLEGRLAQDITAYSDTSQIEAYTQQASLIHLMWGYQLGVFYSDEYGSPSALNDLADWLGINYVFLDPVDDPVDKYVTAGWTKTYGDAEVELWKKTAATPLATALTTPTILVITDPANGSFAQLFRLANEGLAPHSEYLLVEGGSTVEEYSLDDLRRFDIVFLHGYQYKNPEQAWGLLEEYVREGGSLFADTGWQYVVPEWEFESAPAVLPVQRLTWTDYGKQAAYTLNDLTIAGEARVEGFGPLIWEDLPWGVSGASSADLRDWAQPVLSVGGSPLIAAGEYQGGRVAWSGMNLISHMIAYDSQEEALLLHNLLDWLAEGKGFIETDSPTVARDHPDQVWFSVTTQPAEVTWLYWREAFYPNWHAYLTDGAGEREVPIYRAGPGFMLMPLDAKDPQVSVNLRWELPLVEKAGILASLLGLLFLAGLVADGLFLQGNGFTWVKIALVTIVPRPFLGEGSNREWAERKRAELEAGKLSPDTPPHLIPSQAISWWRENSDREQAQVGDLAVAGVQAENGPRTEPTGRSRAEGEAQRSVSSNRALADGDLKAGVPTGPAAADGDGHPPEFAPAIEPPSDDIERALLESWLNGSGHSDDAWAEKLLGRKNNSLEA